MVNSVNNSNNFVAESDYRAALASIENRFATGDGRLPRAGEESLKKNIKRIVQPIPDEEYAKLMRENDMEEEYEEEESDDEESSEEEEEEDEEALLDHAAMERVRQLRREVREASAEMAALAQSVLDKAMSLAGQEISVLRGSMDVPPVPPTAVELMEPGPPLESLVSLTEAMQEMDIPKAAQMLEETIANVERGLQPVEELSQTELAIRSRTNEGRIHYSNENETAEQTLANFLAQRY